jgi:hypothetical protein
MYASAINAIILISVMKYNNEYAKDTERLGEYNADNENSKPNIVARINMFLIFCGIYIMPAVRIRYIDINVIAAIQNA